MERLMHETRETFTTLMVFSCLAVGIIGAVFYTMGPDGWLVERVRVALLDPNLSTLAALSAVIGALALAKRLLDRRNSGGPQQSPRRRVSVWVGLSSSSRASAPFSASGGTSRPCRSFLFPAADRQLGVD